MGTLSPQRLTKGFLAIITTLIASILAIGSPAARADEYQPGYPKLGQDSELVYGHDLYRDGPLGTQLLTIHTDANGGKILAYCIELDVHSEWGGEMTQTGWSAFPGKNEFGKSHQIREKVNWIVQRSYPQVDLTQIASAAGASGLTDRGAITAAQAAIWHLTDNFAFNGLHDWEGARHDTTSERAQRVKKVYDYLLGSANTGLAETSGPSVQVVAPTAPGTSGELVGPIRLTATQPTVTVAKLPYPLVDAQGNEVDLSAVPTGVDLFLKVPADAPAGKATVTASLTGNAHAGQLLVAKNGRWQTNIIVKTQQVTVTGQGEVSWAPKPAPQPTPTPSVTPSPMPSVTPSPTPSVTPTPTPSVTPSPTPSVTPSPTPSVTPSPTPSVTGTASLGECPGPPAEHSPQETGPAEDRQQLMPTTKGPDNMSGPFGFVSRFS